MMIKSSVIAIDCDGAPPLPIFGSIKNIWIICDHVYFEVCALQTIKFTDKFQAYHVETNNQTPVINFCSYESRVDYNIFHIKNDIHRNEYVSVNYDIDDLLEEYMKSNNPLQI